MALNLAPRPDPAATTDGAALALRMPSVAQRAWPLHALPPRGWRGRRGPQPWRERLQDAAHARHLDQVTVRHADLSNLDLSGWTFRRVRFEHCTLRGARWSRCVLEDVAFLNCDLTQATLTDLSVRQLRCADSDLQDLQIQGGR